MSNLGQVTKLTNILVFCGGGPVLIFATDFSFMLKLASISRDGGYHDIMLAVRHRGYHLGWACLRCHRFQLGCWILHPSGCLSGHSEYSSVVG